MVAAEQISMAAVQADRAVAALAARHKESQAAMLHHAVQVAAVVDF